MSSSLRQSIERISVGPLTRASNLPRIVPVLVILGLIIAGALIPGWGWVLLLVVTLLLAWLLYLGWPSLRPSERLMRIAATALIAALTLIRAFPQPL